MKLIGWIKLKLEEWFGVATLRAEIAELRSQIDTTLKLQGENAESLSSLETLVKNSIASNAQMIREAEERMLIRLAALEEQSAARNYTNPEAESSDRPTSSSLGGHVRWTERKRKAEMAETLPQSAEKWLKPRQGPTPKQETT